MKKKSTTRRWILLILLLLWMQGLHAQIFNTWTEAGDDLTAFDFRFPTGAVGILGGQLVLDSAGTAYFIYEHFSFLFRGDKITATKLEGDHWDTVGAPDFAIIDAGNHNGGPTAAVSRQGKLYVTMPGQAFFPPVYTVHDSNWVEAGNPLTAWSGGDPVYPTLAVSSTGILYFAMRNAQTGNPDVFALHDSNWAEIGPSQLGNGGGGQIAEIALDYHNTPYIVYDENVPGGTTPILIVEKFDGTNWVKLGNTTLYSTISNHVIAFDNTDIPYVLSKTGDSATGYNFKLVKLAGNDWTDVGPLISPYNGISFLPAANSGAITQLILSMGPLNTPYVAYQQNLQNRNILYPQPAIADKFDGRNWVPIGDNPVFVGYGVDQATSFAADTIGNVYMSFIDMYQQRIRKLRTAPPLPRPLITFTDVQTSFGAADLAPGAASMDTDRATPILYTIADTAIATVVNGKIHVLRVGSTSITASQAADSAWSAPYPVTVILTVAPAGQTISFPELPEKKLGDPDFPAGAVASSGLPVTYDGSDPSIATVTADGIIHILEKGTITITAHQAGDSNYKAAPDVAQVLVILRGTPPSKKDKLKAYYDDGALQVFIRSAANRQAELELFNQFGRQILKKEIWLSADEDNHFQLPVSNLRDGIYYVRVKGDDLNLVQKVWIDKK